MNKRGILMLAVAALSVLAIVSCAKPPLAEMDAATAAFAKAEADADTRAYAPDSLAKARDTISRMKSEADAKRYDAAKGLAKEATEASEKAIKDGASAKLKAKDDAAAAIQAAKTALADARNAFTGAKAVRRIKLDSKAVDLVLQDAAKDITAAEGDASKADYRAALTKAQGARTKLADILQKISEAVRAATAKK
jgi:hypothetical protein